MANLPAQADSRAIERRLADLAVQSADEGEVPDATALREAIARYELLLADPQSRERDSITYRLARAYELIGDLDQARGYLDALIERFPYSEYVIEARFRRAEQRFVAERYEAAAEDYDYVFANGEGGPYWLNAGYMLGWAKLKLSRPDESLQHFLDVLPSTLERDAPRSSSRELFDDVLRGITLVVENLDGPRTLALATRQLDHPPWQHYLFERLADELEREQRFLDSVAALETFIDENPMDWRAVLFERRAIETLAKGDFPSDVRRHQDMFVRRYGVGTNYWNSYAGDERNDYRSTLRGYLLELARGAHADAQSSGDVADFDSAARYYDQFASSFPDDPEVASNLFLMAEALTDAGKLERAVATFERIVAEHPDFDRAGEAAYAAVLGITKMIELLAAGQDSRELELRRVTAEISFADAFPDHPRASEALLAAAVASFQYENYQQAFDLAQRVEARASNPDELRQRALVVAGHSAFELENFVAAEQAYAEFLAGTETATAESQNVEPKLLASVFEQGERARQAGDLEQAVHHFLRIESIDPTAAIALEGYLNAASIRETQERWMDAAELLSAVRTRFEPTPTTRDIVLRIATCYENASSPRLAGDQYRIAATEVDDPDVQRQSLYRAGELYLQVDESAAKETFSDYAMRYPVPADVAVEAMHYVVELSAGEEKRVWQAHILEQVDSLVEPTDRERFLAAESAIELADGARTTFSSIALENPIADSLKRKQLALTNAVTAYERAAGYQVLAVTTAATFNIADVYAELATAILDSSRPDDLSDLEREQYELLLEEQADPFVDQAIELHETNARRAWEGTYDEWVRRSFERLRSLLPARFDKSEVLASATEIH